MSNKSARKDFAMKTALWLGVVVISGVIGCSQSRGDLGTPMDDLATSAKQPHCTQYDVLMATRATLNADENAKEMTIGRVMYEWRTPVMAGSDRPKIPHWKVEVLGEQAGAKFVLVDDATGLVIP